MKHVPRIIPILLATFTLAHSQESLNLDASEVETTLSSITTTRILGEIPDGTPPPPQPPKPEFHIPTKDVLKSVTHQQGGRNITIRQIKPIALPPPTPVELAPTEADVEFSEHVEEFSEAYTKYRLLFLGATVFRSKDSPPRTLVRYWAGNGNPSIAFWSSADFALIAGGINSYVDSAGDTHSILMAWGNVDIDSMEDLYAARGRDYDAPDMPEFPEGKATFQISGEQPAAEELVAIQSLHDLYNSEFQRLKTAHEGRERARIEHEAYLKANPPQPKDITLNYWRTTKPATKGNGGE